MKVTTLDLAAQLERMDVARGLAGAYVADLQRLNEGIERARELAGGLLHPATELQRQIDTIMPSLVSADLHRQAEERALSFTRGIAEVLSPLASDLAARMLPPNLSAALQAVTVPPFTAFPANMAIAANPVAEAMGRLEAANEQYRRLIFGAMKQAALNATGALAAQVAAEQQQFLWSMWGDICDMVAEVAPEADQDADDANVIEEVRDPKIISAVDLLPPMARAAYAYPSQYVVRSKHYLTPMGTGENSGPATSLYRVGKGLVRVTTKVATAKSTHEACVWLAKVVGQFLN